MRFVTRPDGRPMTRYAALAHGALLSVVFVLPLLRLGWDQWSQSLVHLVLAFFGVLGAVLLLLGRSMDLSRLRGALRRYGPFLAVMGGAAFLSTVRSPFPHSAIPGLLNDFPAVVFFLVATGVSDGRRADYTRALAGAGVLAVVAALLTPPGSSAPFTGPLLNPNLLVALVILTGPLALHYVFTSTSAGVRVFWSLAALSLAVGFLLSRSLAGFGTVAVQAAVAVGLFWNRDRSGAKKMSLFLGGVGLLLGIGLFLSQTEWPKLVHGDPDRWTWGLTALKAFAAHPLLGVGPGAFGEAYPLYRATPWGLNSLYAHNFVLEFLAERGLVGAGALFLWIGLLLRDAKRGLSRGTGPGLFLGLMGFCVYNLFHIGFSFPALYWLFFLAGGLAVPCGDVDPAPPPRKALSIGVVVLGLLFGVLSFALFRSGQFLSKAQFALSTEQGPRAQEWVDRGIWWNRFSPGLYELRAALRLRAQNWDGARADIDRAVALAPGSAGFRIDAAELAVERGDFEEAIRDYEVATHLLPLKADAWERWGDLLARQGRTADADRAYAGALQALGDPRVLGGDADRRAAETRRVEEKKGKLAHGS